MGIIIYPPTIDWNWMKQRPQHLMYQLAENGHLVFYCNQTQSHESPEKIHKNLYIIHDHTNWISTLLPSIRTKYDFVGVWCSYPKLASTLSKYQPSWVVYDCVDDFPEWSIHENEMIAVTDSIVCSSSRLFSRLKRTFHHKQITIVRNAYDPDMNLHNEVDFSIPSDITSHINQNKKIVGYVGAWAPWIDEKLIQLLAKMDDKLSVVVIGPEFGRKFIGKKDYPVHFLGLKPHHELAAYIKHMSICIIPFRITGITLATNPVKAYEYLAAGKPVISTNLPECRLMEPYVDVAQDHHEFLELIKKRIADPGDSLPRINYAMENTWKARAEQIEEVIKSLH